MERIIIHSSDDILELNGFSLQNGDTIEILVLGTWLAGVVAHDKRGWYLQTSPGTGIRLKSGLVTRLGSLSPEPVFWVQESQFHNKNPKTYNLLKSPF